MIRIDALYVLLLIELSVILAGLSVYLLLRVRKTAVLYRNTAKELVRAQQEQEELQNKLAEAQTAAQHAATAGPAAVSSGKDQESDGIEKAVLEEKVKEKTRLLNELQVKFDDLEKEYLILYRQQQAQDQEKK